MRFSIRHLLALTFVIAIVIGAIIAIKDYREKRKTYFDRLGDGLQVERLEAILATLNESAPESDAKMHFDNGEIKYAACTGFAGKLEFSGIPESEWELIRVNGNGWTICESSDVVESGHHVQLIHRAWRYADSYNREMRRLTQLNGSKP